MEARILRAATLAILVLLPAVSSRAAVATTEQFTAGANGWDGASDLGSGIWIFTGSVARLNYVDIGPMPFPDPARMTNTPTASGGAFTGDYDAAGIGLFGFKYFAEASSAGNLSVSWSGSSSTYFRILTTTPTGVWTSVSFSLASFQGGGWSLFNGSVSDFANARKSVSNIIIRFQRAGPGEHNYYIDDLFIEWLPKASSLGVSGSNNLVTWDFVRSNRTYRVEGSTNLLTGTWDLIESITPTGATHVTVDPGVSTNAARFYRMLPQ